MYINLITDKFKTNLFTLLPIYWYCMYLKIQYYYEDKNLKISYGWEFVFV